MCINQYLYFFYDHNITIFLLLSVSLSFLLLDAFISISSLLFFSNGDWRRRRRRRWSIKSREWKRDTEHETSAPHPSNIIYQQHRSSSHLVFTLHFSQAVDLIIGYFLFGASFSWIYSPHSSSLCRRRLLLLSLLLCCMYCGWYCAVSLVLFCLAIDAWLVYTELHITLIAITWKIMKQYSYIYRICSGCYKWAVQYVYVCTMHENDVVDDGVINSYKKCKNNINSTPTFISLHSARAFSLPPFRLITLAIPSFSNSHQLSIVILYEFCRQFACNFTHFIGWNFVYWTPGSMYALVRIQNELVNSLTSGTE